MKTFLSKSTIIERCGLQKFRALPSRTKLLMTSVVMAASLSF